MPLRYSPVVFLIVLLGILLSSPIASAQTDTTELSVSTEALSDTTASDSLSEKKKFFFTRLLFPPKRPPYDPNIAWQRSLILPGWGQIYNKRWWKLPFVYGAYVGMALVIDFNNGEYNRFRLAYRYRLDEDDTTDAASLDIPDFVPDDGIRQARDNARRNRDLAIIGTIGIHLLQVIEAYVDAHLRDFDVSNDLSFRVKPSFSNPVANSPLGVSMPGCAVVFSF